MRLYFHIGMPNVGSSTLQRTLDANRTAVEQGGFWCPPNGSGANSDAQAAHGRESPLDAVDQLLGAERRDCNLFLSSDHLYNLWQRPLGAKRLRIIAESLRERDVELRLLMICREANEWLLSMYKPYLLKGIRNASKAKEFIADPEMSTLADHASAANFFSQTMLPSEIKLANVAERNWLENAIEWMGLPAKTMEISAAVVDPQISDVYFEIIRQVNAQQPDRQTNIAIRRAIQEITGVNGQAVQQPGNRTAVGQDRGALLSCLDRLQYDTNEPLSYTEEEFASAVTELRNWALQTAPAAAGWRISMDDLKDDKISFAVGPVKQRTNRTWFRGEHCNFSPAALDMADSGAVRRHILTGWIPPEPCIDFDTRIVAFGSCFAGNIAKWLSARKFNVLTGKGRDYADTYLVRCGEGMVNTFVIRQQFEWALEGKVFTEELWHGYDAEAFGYDETVRLRTREVMTAADVFIITLGLSEVWYDEVTGGVFWRAVPLRSYDPSRHKFRVSTVSENKENIVAIVDLIKRARPDAKIIFTLSPIELVATFRNVSCITANTVSKAVLRVSIDEVVREMASQDVFYWPSYEIVTKAFANPWRGDRRHVQQSVLDFIMALFEEAWCRGTKPNMTIAEAWVHACASARMIDPDVLRAIETQDTEAIDAALQKDSEGIGRAIILDRLREIAAANPDCRLGQWLSAQSATEHRRRRGRRERVDVGSRAMAGATSADAPA